MRQRRGRRAFLRQFWGRRLAQRRSLRKTGAGHGGLIRAGEFHASLADAAFAGAKRPSGRGKPACFKGRRLNIWPRDDERRAGFGRAAPVYIKTPQPMGCGVFCFFRGFVGWMTPRGAFFAPVSAGRSGVLSNCGSRHRMRRVYRMPNRRWPFSVVFSAISSMDRPLSSAAFLAMRGRYREEFRRPRWGSGAM